MSEQVFLNGAPVVGFGLGAAEETTPTATSISPWKEAVVASIVGAATSWVIDGIVQSTRKKRRR